MGFAPGLHTRSSHSPAFPIHKPLALTGSGDWGTRNHTRHAPTSHSSVDTLLPTAHTFREFSPPDSVELTTRQGHQLKSDQAEEATPKLETPPEALRPPADGLTINFFQFAEEFMARATRHNLFALHREPDHALPSRQTLYSGGARNDTTMVRKVTHASSAPANEEIGIVTMNRTRGTLALVSPHEVGFEPSWSSYDRATFGRVKDNFSEDIAALNQHGGVNGLVIGGNTTEGSKRLAQTSADLLHAGGTNPSRLTGSRSATSFMMNAPEHQVDVFVDCYPPIRTFAHVLQRFQDINLAPGTLVKTPDGQTHNHLLQPHTIAR